MRGRAFRVKQCWWMEHHLFSLRKERERFRERSDLQDAAAAAFRKREIRRLNLRVLFSPTLRRENRGERSGYIPTYPSDYLPEFCESTWRKYISEVKWRRGLNQQVLHTEQRAGSRIRCHPGSGWRRLRSFLPW